ncbi:MAG: UbiA family prenyltransferase [Cyclobacteriaceae bacterium]
MAIFNISRSTWLHLRIPFSFFLLPVFIFALAVGEHASVTNIIMVFVILHFLLYPASNGYNSYFDNDEDSIGLLQYPPMVTKDLYYISLLLDAIAIGLGAFISIPFAVMLLVYGLASKAYSHPAIRLKSYPFAGWFIAGFFQGFFTFMMCIEGLNPTGWEIFRDPMMIVPASLTSMLLWGSYPMTQIYQHEEDYSRGDRTLSLVLGIRGTFYFTAIFFLLANFGFVLYFFLVFSLNAALFFQMFLIPILTYFLIWYTKVHRDPDYADYRHTMELNTISAVCLNMFFVFLWISFS